MNKATRARAASPSKAAVKHRQAAITAGKGRKAAPSFVEAVEPDEATLEAIRAKLREARAIEMQVSDYTESAKLKAKELIALKHETLPDLFAQAGVDKLGLPAEGNDPAYDCSLHKFYHATIAASWPDEKRQQAFDYLKKNGAEDLIKTEVVVYLNPEDRTKLKGLLAYLKTNKLPMVEISSNVPWNSLTAWVREQVEAGETLPLETLGAQVGMVVRMKPRKER